MKNKKKIYCLAPVYNDWESCTILLSHLEQLKLAHNSYEFYVILIWMVR